MKKKSNREFEANRREGDVVSSRGGDGGVAASGESVFDCGEGHLCGGGSDSSRSSRERERMVGVARLEEGTTSKGKEVASDVEETPADPTIEDTFTMIDVIAVELDSHSTDPEMDAAVWASLEEAA